MSQPTLVSHSNIFYSSVQKEYYNQELVIRHTSLVHIFSGEMKVIQADRKYAFVAGNTVLFPVNQVAKVIKYPVGEQPYRSSSIYYPQEILQKYYATRQPGEIKGDPKIKLLDAHPLLDSLFNSLLPYFNLREKLPDDIAEVKLIESLSILRSLDPDVDNILYRFSSPGKIDLVDFMQKNYMFNLSLERFSYLTGRSLTSFKRDFARAFGVAPRKWMIQKRLEHAHYLIFEQQQKPSEVYFEVGFENLSHFSYAFKKHFGYNPSIQKLDRGTK